MDASRTTTSSRLRLGFAGAQGLSEAHLSVDGMTPAGPNLSHWPGNRTPAKWKADLSTAIALRFARAAAAEQDDFLGGVRLVVNDHYDTDGFGSLLAVLRPDVAFAHEELVLAAAATGDFAVWQTRRGFAIDRIVANLAHPASPARRELPACADPDASALARYAWLLANAHDVLRLPPEFEPLFADEMARVQNEIAAGLRGALERWRHADLDLAAVTSRGPVCRLTLNTLAGAYRVLHVQHDRDGTRFRYHDRTESWFELVTFHPLPRRDLRPLAERLAQLEPPHDGACWTADPPSEPIPEAYFGVPAPQPYGQSTRTLVPSRLPPARVLAAVVEHFEGGPA